MKKFLLNTYLLIGYSCFQLNPCFSMQDSMKIKRVSGNTFTSTYDRPFKRSIKLKNSKEKASVETIDLEKILKEDFSIFHNTPSIAYNDLIITPMHYAIIENNLLLIKKFMGKLNQPYTEWISENHYQTCHQKDSVYPCYLQIAQELNKDDICSYFLEEQKLSPICQLTGALIINDMYTLNNYMFKKTISLEEQKIIQCELIKNINNLFDGKNSLKDSSGNRLDKEGGKIFFLHERIEALENILAKQEIEGIKKKLWNVFLSHHKTLFSKESEIYKNNSSQDFIPNFDEKKECLKHFFELLFTKNFFLKSPSSDFARKILSIFYAHYFSYSKIELPFKGAGYHLSKEILKIYIRAAAKKLHKIPLQKNNIPNFLHQACQFEDYTLVKLILINGNLDVNCTNNKEKKPIDIIFKKMKNNLYLNLNNRQKNKNTNLLKIFALLIKKNSNFSTEMATFITNIEEEYAIKILEKFNTIEIAQNKLIDENKSSQQNSFFSMGFI